MKILISGFVFAALLLAEGPVSPPGSGVSKNPSAENASAPGQPGGRTANELRNPSDLSVTVNSSIVLDQAAGIRRISIANGEIAEAVAVSSNEILLNGKSPGDTSLIIWNLKDTRSTFQVHVLASNSKIEAVQAELRREVGPDLSLTFEDGNVFLRGTAIDTVSADRALSIASTLGKVVNLLRVLVPAGDPQIVLKVRFADVDREAATQLGVNIFGVNPLKGGGNITTGQFGQSPTLTIGGPGTGATLTDFLNIFYYRPDINLGAVIQALQTKNVLQILAEPNLLATSGRPASFLAGGEFPFPTLQGGGSGVGQITIQFKEFGIRLNFLPTVTPRGTIRLVVTPEVSSLDYGNGLTVNGFTVPGLDTRRVQTEVELEDGQSFVIAGLLNNQVIENLNKIPGLSNIPLLGKLFESRSLQRNNSELLVMVTPQIVRPIPAGAKPPQVNMPLPFMKGTAPAAPQNPGPDVNGPVMSLSKQSSLPIEQLKSSQMSSGSSGAAGANPTAAVPPAMPIQPTQAPPAPSGPPPQTN